MRKARRSVINTGFPLDGPTLGEIGEDAVIRSIIEASPSAVNGDDAAVLHPPSPNSRMVATTDMMVEGRHFRSDLTTPFLLGRKAVVQNFADIEAMGARPLAALLSFSAPSRTPAAVVADIARGIGTELDKYGTELVGGDVTAGQSLVLSITAIGSLGGNRPPLMLTGARAGQTVVAHGRIGYSAAGLELLESGITIPAELEPLAHAYQSPELTPGCGMVARSAGATSMTDNSDGLLHDVGVLAQRSGVRIDLNSDAIAPDALLVKAGEMLGVDPWKWVCEGGEDHTLIGTLQAEAPVGFRPIGTVHKPSSESGSSAATTSSISVTIDGNAPQYTRGWESFS